LKKVEPFEIIHLKAYTLAKCQGKRNKLLQVIENAGIIFRQTEAHKDTLLMIDYRKVDFAFPMNDAFNLAKMFELMLSDYQHIKMVVICAEHNLNFGAFWKEISQKRGFNFNVFTDEEEAEQWLMA